MSRARQLVRALNPTLRPPLRRRAAIVTNIGSGTVDVQVAGDTSVTLTGLAYLSGYAPVVNDLVWILADGPDWIVLGSTLASPFISYAPAITGSPSPTMTTTGRYRVLPGGFVQGQARVTVVTSLGSGTYTASLPLTPAAGYAGEDPLGVLHYIKNGGTHVMGAVVYSATDQVSFLIATPNSANPNLTRWSSSTPAGQINGDLWFWSYAYQAE